ncbi:MAG: helix-turn-helix domain-containing protein, partial [Bacteroidota bacterium]
VLFRSAPSNDQDEPPTILLVEDNEDLAIYIGSCLSDYRLFTAKNGLEGFTLAADYIPDLIISDVMMPVMDGFTFCQKLKTDPRTDHIPVIILTARADMESKLEGLELGANAYLPKPFEQQELLLHVKNLFDYRDRLRLRYQNTVKIDDTSILDSPTSLPPEDPFVVEVRNLVQDHLSDFTFSVEELAKLLHLSPSQCGRKLNALTGYTPSRFIRRQRLQQATQLLLDEELSITAVAYDCGFQDPGYFIRVFKKELGVTPGQWREEQLSDAAAPKG